MAPLLTATHSTVHGDVEIRYISSTAITRRDLDRPNHVSEFRVLHLPRLSPYDRQEVCARFGGSQILLCLSLTSDVSLLLTSYSCAKYHSCSV